MRRRTGKLMLASLMSAALICSNMSFVYATEQTPAEVSESAASEESSEQAKSAEAEVEEKTEAEAAEKTEAEDVEKTEAETEEQTEDVEKAETETEEQTEDAETEETEEQTETEEATETEEEAGEELLFVDKDGNEITPSSLVGTDYTTIADSYDGVENIIKKYEESDEYEENMIMDSYVDEDGNLVIVISKGPAKEEAAPSLFKLNSSSVGDAPAVDGSFTGWDDIPASYEFNWNKPDAWVDGVHYTETNSTDVRHEMKLYTDGENVYLKVVFAREFCNGQVANGNDYQFWVDNEQMAAYQVEWPNGSSLSNNTAEPG